NLDNDLKKVIAYSGEEITASDVGAVLSVNPENNVFAMLDAIGRNRKDEALRLLYNLLESGTTVFSLLRMITGQLELILSIKEMKENGMNLTQIQKKLGVHQFRVKKAAAVGGNCSVSYLKNILSEAYQVDEHIKTGLFDGQLALEYFIAKL
ncbi:MAG: DNA polymerase III subunit delta, partial [Clostridia bacterium]